MKRNSFGTQIESGSMLVLTPGEKRLLRRFAQGKTDKTMAHEIGDTQERIAAQRQRVTDKLQIRSPDELVAIA